MLTLSPDSSRFSGLLTDCARMATFISALASGRKSEPKRAPRPRHSRPRGKKSQTLVPDRVVTSVILEGCCLRYPEVRFMGGGSFWVSALGKTFPIFPWLGYKRKQSRIWAAAFRRCADLGPSY